MTASNRNASITETLQWEGGYSNDKNDPGGPTNWGITIFDARKYWKKDATAADVKNMPKSVALDIYTTKYWKTPYYDCDKLAAGVDFAVFDFGVHSGPARAKKYLDLSVGGTDSSTITKLCQARLGFLHSLGTWSSFGKGWSRRVAGVQAKALEMNKTKPSVGGGLIVGGGAVVAGATAAHHNSVMHMIEFGVGVAIVGFILFVAYEIYKHRKNTNV